MPRGFVSCDLPGKGRCRIHVESSLVIGRAEDCDLVIVDPAASRRHLEIKEEGGGFVWKDLKSRNGTRHNGSASEGGPLRDGDQLKIGGTIIAFEFEGEAAVVPSTLISEAILGGSQVGPPAQGKADDLLRAVYTVMDEISSNYDPCPLVDKILQTTMKAVEAQRGAVFFGGPSSRGDLLPCPDCGHTHMIVNGKLCHGDCGEVRISKTIARKVLEGGESVLFRETDALSMMPTSKSIEALHLRSVICVPVRGKYGILGVLYMDNDRSGREYSREDLLLSAAVGKSAGLALENATFHREVLEKLRIDQEIEFAAAIQEGFLVRDWSSRDPRFDAFGETSPARTVGGDFYDIARPGADRVVSIIGDVSGKGVPASLAMAQIVAEFRLHARDLSSPGKIIGELNAGMVKRSTRGLFSTMCCAIFDLSSGAVLWANAGHPPPIHLGHGGAALLEGAAGPPAGVLPEAAWQDQEARIAPGETVLLYTDGVMEARSGATSGPGAEGFTEYGLERLRERAGAGFGLPPRELIGSVVEDVRRFSAPGVPHDDVTLFALRFRG